MNWYWFFYLFSVADKLHSTFLTFSIILGIGFIIFFFIWLFQEEVDSDLDPREDYDKMSTDNPKGFKKFMWWFRTLLVSCLIFIFFTVAIPRKKEMLLILAGGAVGEFVTSNEDAKQLPADITKFLRHEIMAATEDLKEEAQKEVKAALNVEEKLEDLPKEELIRRLKEQGQELIE